MPFFPANTQQSVQLGDTVRLGMTFVNPSGILVPFGMLAPVNSDVTPIWQSRINDSDTVVQTGNFTLRAGCSGYYRANFVASAANGYHAGDYVEVMASGKFKNVSDVGPICSFVINGFQSGVWSAVQSQYAGGQPGLSLTFGSGLQAGLGGVFNAALVQIGSSGLNTATYIADQVWNALQVSYRANGTFGSGDQTTLGAVFNANLVQIGGSGIQLAGVVPANVIQVGGSGVNLAGTVPANVTQISGLGVAQSTYVADQTWNAPTTYTANLTMGSGLNNLNQDVYYADIKVVNGSPAPNNEYGVTWFKNAFQVPSGNITNPALSVFNTTNGVALISNAVMTFSSTQLGSLSWIEPTNRMASGVPYLVITSGLIAGVNQVWQGVKGLDFM